MRLGDCLSRMRFHSTGAMELLCFRIDLLSTIAFAISLVILVSAPEGVINPSFAGLAVTYALNLNSLQSTLIWKLCDLENKMISVERMLQYINIPSEPPLVIESPRPEEYLIMITIILFSKRINGIISLQEHKFSPTKSPDLVRTQNVGSPVNSKAGP